MHTASPAVLAREIAQRMLHPGPLDGPIQSGLFLHGPRGVGKTSFLKLHLIPELEVQGALVRYVDFSDHLNTDLIDLVSEAARRLVTERVQSKPSPLHSPGNPKSMVLAQVFTELIDQTRASVVIIMDEVQCALESPSGKALLLALKAARDAVNLRPDTPGWLLILGVSSNSRQIQAMVAGGDQAFLGALAIPFPQ